MNHIQICDSKKKYTLLAAQFEVFDQEKGLSQSYYKCKVCKQYHVYTINKKVAEKRKNSMYKRDSKDVYLAKKFKKKRNGFKKR